MKSVQLKDIAKAASVSPSTVSRVVRSNGYVSAAKQQAVQAAMMSLGYIRNEVKPTITESTMPLIGLLTLGAQNGLMFARMADSLNQAAQAQGYLIVNVDISGDLSAKHITDVVNKLMSLHVSGIIFGSLGDLVDFMSIRKFIVNIPIPLVMIERVPDIYGLNKVLVNSKEGLFIAVKHLIGHGHWRILYMAIDHPQNEVESSRLAGFQAATSAMNCEDSAIYFPCPPKQYPDGRKSFIDFLAQNEMPTAIIASDMLLVGILKYLYEQGIRIPKDISIVGVNDDLSRFSAPALTSLAFPEKEIAENAVSIIHLAQDGNAIPKTILLSPQLIERDSIAEPRE